jgi:integrative and conjugative element protein (TIGR02256 family)
LTCIHKGLNVEIEQELLDELYHEGMKYYPKEFGGLLIGCYSEDFKTCVIKTSIIPMKYKSSRYYFERGIEGLKQKLVEFYNSNPRLIYVGEWHTHPDGVPSPSSTDLNAMSEIAESTDVSIENPILMILGINKTEMKLGTFVFSKNKLLKYE